MTTTTPHMTPPPTRRRTRIPLLVAGLVAAVLGLGAVVGGGGALWADATKDEHGYVATDDHRFKSGSSAIVSENLEVDLDGAEWLVDEDQFGKVRLEVDSAGSDPVFVGIARTEDVDRYLRDVAHTRVANVDYAPFDVDYDERGGDRPPMPPGNARFWTEAAEGTGAQSLTWKVQDGDWSIVVMNADGSPGVAADVSAGANMPWLDDLGWGLLGFGVLMYAGAVAMIIAAYRDPSGPRGASAPATPAATAPAAS